MTLNLPVNLPRYNELCQSVKLKHKASTPNDKKTAGIAQEPSSHVNSNFILQSFDNLRKVRSDFQNFQRCFSNLMAILNAT